MKMSSSVLELSDRSDYSGGIRTRLHTEHKYTLWTE
jgi:hypothetical protein